MLIPSEVTDSTSHKSHSAPSSSTQPDIDWAEQTSRLADLGREKGAQLNNIATHIYQQGSTAAQGAQKTLSNPEKRREFLERYGKTFKIGAAAILAIGVIAYWGVSHEASRIADQKIHSFLVQNGLSSRLQYASVSASPWGHVTLHDVTILTPTHDKVGISRLSITHADIGSTLPANIQIAASGIECSLTTATSCPIIAPRDRASLLALGYTSLTGDMSASYHLHNGHFSLETHGELKHGFSWNFNASFSGVPDDVLETVPTLINMQAPLQVMRFFNQMQNAELSNITINIDTSDITKRLKAVPDTPLPITDTSNTPDTPLGRWEQNGGRLNIKSNMDSGIPLIRTIFGVPTPNPEFQELFESPNQFFQAIHADISTD
ncbi:hypothetical protein [Neokomagataea thailandica]|uniref:hypothetical protein n=1 Tax=Neokomagataea thailandica TaxID=661190 RepID=UPI0012EDA02A|nr:hypothetical protein [Neokomagataea thailandica]